MTHTQNRRATTAGFLDLGLFGKICPRFIRPKYIAYNYNVYGIEAFYARKKVGPMGPVWGSWGASYHRVIGQIMMVEQSRLT